MTEVAIYNYIKNEFTTVCLKLTIMSDIVFLIFPPKEVPVEEDNHDTYIVALRPKIDHPFIDTDADDIRDMLLTSYFQTTVLGLVDTKREYALDIPIVWILKNPTTIPDVSVYKFAMPNIDDITEYRWKKIFKMIRMTATFPNFEPYSNLEFSNKNGVVEMTLPTDALEMIEYIGKTLSKNSDWKLVECQ